MREAARLAAPFLAVRVDDVADFFAAFFAGCVRVVLLRAPDVLRPAFGVLLDDRADWLFPDARVVLEDRLAAVARGARGFRALAVSGVRARRVRRGAGASSASASP